MQNDEASAGGRAIAIISREDENSLRMIYGPPGSFVTLTATSHSSTNPVVVDWEMKNSVNNAAPRYSRERTVHLPIGWYASPRLGVAPADTKRIELSSDEGGTVLGSQSTGWGGAFRDSIAVDQSCMVDFAAYANPGWEFVSWEPNIDDDWDARQVSSSMLSAVKATFQPKVECILELEVENAGGNGQPQCAGYVTVDESKRYYTPLDDPVTLTAIPEPGYAFLRWEGDFLEPTTQNPLELDVADHGIDRSIKAVFGPLSALVVEGGCVFGNSEAPSFLAQIDIDHTLLTLPSKSQVQAELPSHNIFVFNGHGSAGALTIVCCEENEENDINLTPDDVAQAQSGVEFSYELLFLNTCSSTASQTSDWLSAFNCNTLVGWDNTVGGKTADAFDLWFWHSAVQEGVSIVTAVNDGWTNQATVVFRMIENEPGVPEVVGNGGLVLNPQCM